MCTPGSSAPRRVARHSRDKQNPSTNAAPTKRRRSSSRRETSLETAKAIGPWPLRAPSPTPRTATQQSPHTTSRATWDSGISLSLPSAASLAFKAKQKYDGIYGADRPPLPPSIDEQAAFFFGRGELYTVYLRTYIDWNEFSAPPNAGHLATADLLLTGGIITAVSTNVDTLIETAGNQLFGNVAMGVSRAAVATLPPNKSPLLKISWMLVRTRRDDLGVRSSRRRTGEK